MAFRRISLLRIAATAAVICLHTASTLTEHPDLFPMTVPEQHFFQAGHLVFRWAVPIFFMITGALLLRPEKAVTYAVCLKKYVRRILLALLIFGIPFAGLIAFHGGARGSALILASVAAPFTGKSFSHLWYLYALIGIYLILPLLRAFAGKAEKREYRVLLAVLFVTVFLIPSVNRITGARIAFSVPLGYPVFYVLTGYYVTRFGKRLAGAAYAVPIAALIALLIVFAVTGTASGEWELYDDPLQAVLSILIFSAVCCGRTGETHTEHAAGTQPGPRTRRELILWRIDRLCFGAYLVHPVFIHFCYRFLKITPVSFGNPYAASVGFAAVFILAGFAASRLFSLIGPLRKHVLG